MNFTSPNYPSKYSDNAFKALDISAPEGYAISIALNMLDIANDFLYFGDGVDHFSTGNESCSQWKLLDISLSNLNFTSKSSTIILVFTSDFTVVGSGFYIEVTPVRLDNYPMHTAGEIHFLLILF